MDQPEIIYEALVKVFYFKKSFLDESQQKQNIFNSKLSQITCAAQNIYEKLPIIQHHSNELLGNTDNIDNFLQSNKEEEFIFLELQNQKYFNFKIE